MMMLEKIEACPNGCPSRPTGTWNYDAQRCESCGYDALKPHDCMEATQEFRLQNDREWREKLNHAKAERDALLAMVLRYGDAISDAVRGADDSEGGRAYFGSTNTLDRLRDIRREFFEWQLRRTDDGEKERD